jgi:hypothetical protein
LSKLDKSPHHIYQPCQRKKSLASPSWCKAESDDIKQITPLLFTFFATVYLPSFDLNEDGRIKENQLMTLHYQF